MTWRQRHNVARPLAVVCTAFAMAEAPSAALDASLQRKIDEAVEAKVSALMKGMETRFSEMLSSLEQKQKEVNELRETLEVRSAVLVPIDRRCRKSGKSSISSDRLRSFLSLRNPTRSAGTRTARSRFATAQARAGCVSSLLEFLSSISKGLFAKRDLKKGEVLLAPIPYVRISCHALCVCP